LLDKRIKQLRIKNKLSQTELGAKLKLSQQAIAKWEKGVSEPDAENISKLADMFGVTTDYLLGKSKTPYPVPTTQQDISDDEREIRLIARGISELNHEDKEMIMKFLQYAQERGREAAKA